MPNRSGYAIFRALGQSLLYATNAMNKGVVPRMKLFIEAQIQEIRGGYEARSATLELCGHGENSDRALRSLSTAVAAWGEGLRQAGVLEEVLDRRSVSHHGDGPVEVEWSGVAQTAA